MPARFAHALFGFILSGLMSFFVSAIAIMRNAGLAEGFIALWASAWLLSWALAFPVVLVVAPITRRLVGAMVKTEGANAQ